MSDVELGLISLTVTLLGALVLVVWRASSLVTELKGAVAAIERGLEAVRAGLEALADIPLLKQRIGAIEELIKKQQSDHRELRNKVESTREKLASLHEGDAQ